MDITEKEILDLKNLVFLLNKKPNCAIIVEGKLDSAALKKIGVSAKILEFHRYHGLMKFVDAVSHYKSLVILFDRDRKGRYLTAKIIEQLERRTKIDLSFKRKLVSITKGKIRFIEDLASYEYFLN